MRPLLAGLVQCESGLIDLRSKKSPDKRHKFSVKGAAQNKSRVVEEVGVDTYLWVESLTRAACMPFVMSPRSLVVLRIINLFCLALLSK